MDIIIATAIPYSPSNPDDPLRQLDLYAPTAPHSGPLLCFVHGGAWRAEDKALHAPLAQRLAAATGCPVAVPNYRLTRPENQDPVLRHPIHCQDLLDCLLFLTQHHDHLPSYDTNAIVLIGHSCSAHMISCLLLKDGIFDGQFENEPACQDILRSVKAAIFSEGIYDLDALIARFPDYKEWFIQPAFGPPEPPAGLGYAQFSALRFSPRDLTDHIHWLLLHSPNDTLVNLEQSTEMHQHLLAVAPNPDHVHLNTHDLTQDHDDVVTADTYIDIIHKFISKLI